MPFPFKQLLLLGLAAILAASSYAASELIEIKSKTHWAFQAIANPSPPPVNGSTWPKNELDHFILAKLEAEDLTPSNPADRQTLLRRAHVTLTGLQPSYEQTQAFINDTSPDAFAKVVDQLLASPQYGERWARHWLDVARYADTKGYVFEEARQYPYAYTFRDWVIRSLNADMPYDQFLRYQLAADKMVANEEDKRHLAAMGFLTVGRRFLNRQPDIIDDRIDVVARGTMALTVACSRCHDHKYDPIPTADYYSLYGVFASSEEPKELPLLGAQPTTPETEEFQRELKAKEAKVDAHLQKRLNDQREEEQIKNYLLALKDGHGKNDQELKKLASSRGLVQSFLLRWRDGIDKKPADDPIFSPWKACFDLTPENFASEAPQRLEPLLQSPTINPRVVLALEGKPLASIGELAAAYAKLFAHDRQDKPHEKPEREQVRLALQGPGSPTDVPLDQLVRQLPTPDQQHVRKLRREIEKHRAEHPGAPPRGMVMTDRSKPDDPYVFVRGQQSNRGPKVPRQFPAIVAGENRKPFPADSSGRLEMADLIASRENPLTARVIVNRVWMHHFGQALVNTPSDFGLRSDPPSHPELLDFLAHRFMDEGWSLKKLHRHILLSASFQQSSAHNPNKAAKDPENRLLWRMNRQRLDFESMRDSLIQASGQLDREMFGRPYDIAKMPFTNRRTIYSEVERQNLENVFRTFDFASPDAHCPQRYETTVPQQALFMMNSPFIESLAGSLADSPSLTTSAPIGEKLRYLYRQIFARDPDQQELQIGTDFISQAGAGSATDWQYGYGSFVNQQVTFTPFPEFTGSVYQGGATLPDPTTGWASLHKAGGHPGHGQHFNAILRFTAPESGSYSIGTELAVPAQMSDGIIVSAVTNGTDLIRQQPVPATGQSSFRLTDLNLAAGMTLDLIVACGPSDSHDSFHWNPTIKNHTTGQSWSYGEEFGPGKAPPSPWQQYAQTLLSTNEFAFID